MSEAAQYTSPGCTSYILFIDHFRDTACPPLSLTTPLGFPVVPEVYKIYKGSFASTSIGLAKKASLINSLQSKSWLGLS